MSWILGGPCKKLIKYDGMSLDLSALNVPQIPGLGAFNLGELNIKRELVQAAAELAQLIDAAQFANCISIDLIPKESPERIRLVTQAMESQKNLIQFYFVMKLFEKNPTNEHLQKALADWIASQAKHTNQLSDQAESFARSLSEEKKAEIQAPTRQQIAARIEHAKKVDPDLAAAFARGDEFDLTKAVDSLQENATR